MKSEKHLLTVPFVSVEDIITLKAFLRKNLREGGNALRLRGRHSNRKAVLGSKWRKGAQNDIPWRLAETVSFYVR